jgi:biopolymer transport protein ExbD
MDDLLWHAQYVADPLLIFAAVLLWKRKLAGYLLLPVYALAKLVAMGLVLAPQVQRIINPPTGIIWWAQGDGWVGLFRNGLYIVHVAFAVGLLIWLARPRIIRQVIDWPRAVAVPLSPEAGRRYARRVWPSAVGAASIALGAQGLAWLIGLACWIHAHVLLDSFWPRVQYAWLQVVGNLPVADTTAALVPGLLGVSLLVAGVALVRRWWAAVPLHLLLAAMLLAFLACLLTGFPWPDDPSELVEPDVGGRWFLLLVLSRPVFPLYAMFLLAWFARPRAIRQARLWRRAARRRSRRGGWAGRWFAMAARAACLLVVFMLLLATCAWRFWPKTPPGVEVFGQEVSLPVSSAREPLRYPPRNCDIVVCVNAAGRAYLDGELRPTLPNLRQGLASRRMVDPKSGVWLAVDRRARFADVHPVLRACGARSMNADIRGVALLAERGAWSSDWMKCLDGPILDVGLADGQADSGESDPSWDFMVHASAEGKITFKAGNEPARTGPVSALNGWLPVTKGNSGGTILISADDGATFEQVVLAVDACLATMNHPYLRITPPAAPATRPAAERPTRDE